jgi:hypothetical protein
MMEGRGLDSCSSGQGEAGSSCEHGHEPSNSITCPEFRDLAEELMASPEGLLYRDA